MKTGHETNETNHETTQYVFMLFTIVCIRFYYFVAHVHTLFLVSYQHVLMFVKSEKVGECSRKLEKVGEGGGQFLASYLFLILFNCVYDCLISF